MKVRRQPIPLRNPRPKLFDYPPPDLAAKINACHASGVGLSQFERKFISDFPSLRKRSPGTWRIFWGICAKCGVEQ